MPYKTLKELPDEVKELPKHAQEIWMAAFNAAIEQYEGDEEKAFGTAWAAVKEKYRKEGDRWVARGGEHMLEGKWIAVFKTGTHTDSKGRVRDWTVDDLDHMIASYDPAEHEAPAVIGHPEMNAPAYAWVEGLKRVGNFLYAKFKQVVPEFDDILARGLFKKRSIAVYPDGTLRHIGFLGATAPAVKGLPDVGFKSGDAASIVEFDPYGADPNFAATEEEKEAQEKRSKKYGIGIKEGGHVTKPSEWDDVADDDFLEPVNYRYPCPDADQTRAAASYWGKPKNQAQYSSEEQAIINRRLEAKKKKFNIAQEGKKKTGGTNMSVKDRLKSIFSKGLENLPDDDALLQDDPPRTFTQAEVKAEVEKMEKETRDDERKKVENEFAEKAKEKAREARKKDISTWVETMSKEGKLVPAIVKYGIPEIMEHLAKSDDVIEFGEEKEKATPYDRFKGLFETVLPKLINLGEIATGDKDVGDSDEAKKEQLIETYMEKHQGVAYKEAVLAVSKKHPDLFKARA